MGRGFCFEVVMEYIVPILLLVFMEGVLSLDNAMVLALLAKELPANERKKALTYGIVGAFGFRVLALLFLQLLMRATWIKFFGGGYLLYMAYQHFTQDEEAKSVKTLTRSFWATVAVIELTDIAFSVDSILASVAVSPNFYVVLTGGILGIVMMRFAATLFMRLLDRFPRLNHTAYSLVGLIGAKLMLECLGVNMHSGKYAFVFWCVMAVVLVHGFMEKGSFSNAKTQE
jgi:YkoY family integral membrane protein